MLGRLGKAELRLRNVGPVRACVPLHRVLRRLGKAELRLRNFGSIRISGPMRKSNEGIRV